MSLKNLNQIGIDSQQSFLKYNKEEIKLSKDFKALFTKIIQKNPKESVRFSEYTTIVKNSKGLTTTFPNQWFYIASFFVDYIKSLKEYKEHFNQALGNVNKDKLAEIKKTKEIPLEIKDKIKTYFKSETDVENFTKFLSDYDWWFGSKTIDRGDYFVSPILSLAKVVNASQSYISDLAYLLSESSQLLNYLKQSEISSNIPKKTDDTDKNESINLKESFAEWLFNQGKYKRVYKDDKSILIKKLNEYEEAYEIDFGISIFDYQKFSLESIISELESNIIDDSGNIGDLNKKTVGNGAIKAILGKNNYIKFLKELLFNQKKQESKIAKEQIEQINFNLKIFIEDCQKSGLTYSNQITSRYISSLATKPFVLLSGLSGSGKTKLAQSFAQWICEDEKQYCIVPVGADWTNREPLLGYVNALNSEEYILPENGALQLIIEANKGENKNKPYFLILDEMNLSHVERYFADFLSVIESKDKFKLHSDKEQEKTGVPFELSWPKNLFIVGTVNIDETTYMFSPKVLDRANAIEFRVTEKEISKFLKSPNQIDLTQLESKGANMAADFIKTARNNEFEEINTDDLNDTLVNFFGQLQKTGAEFGYRTGMEIHRLYQQLTVINGSITENEKIDIAVMQKLLPKLHGSRRKLCPILEILGNICVKNIDVKKDIFENEDFKLYEEVDGKLVLTKGVLYPLSLEKITRMYKGAIDNGFASYAEA